MDAATVRRDLETDLHRKEPRVVLQCVLAGVLLVIASAMSSVVALVVNLLVHGRPADGHIGRETAMAFPGLAVGLAAEAVTGVVLYLLFVGWLARRQTYEIALPGALREAGTGLLIGAGLMAVVVGILAALGSSHVTRVASTPASSPGG